MVGDAYESGPWDALPGRYSRSEGGFDNGAGYRSATDNGKNGPDYGAGYGSGLGNGPNGPGDGSEYGPGYGSERGPRARPQPRPEPEPDDIPDVGLPVIIARPVPAHAVPLWPLGVRLVVRVLALSWPFFWALLRYLQQPVYAAASAGCQPDCVSPKVAYAHGIFPWLFAYSVVSLLGVNSVIFLLRQRRGGTAAADDLPVPFIAKFAVFVTLCGVAFAIGVLRGMSIWIYGR